MDLGLTNSLCAIKVKSRLGVSFLVDTTVPPKGKAGLGGTIVGVLVRGPGMTLNLGPWFCVVAGRSHELPVTRAMRYLRQDRARDPAPFQLVGREVLKNSKRVNGEFVLPCSGHWPSSMDYDLSHVKVVDSSGPQKNGRYGLVWGRILPSLRTAMGPFARLQAYHLVGGGPKG